VQFDSARAVPLVLEAGGYFSGFVDDVAAGARYKFRLDEGEACPDPASRFQPDGPHGFSEVVDPYRFDWTDQAWSGLSIARQVVYEMHIGTFTTEGTWLSALEQLPNLAELGVVRPTEEGGYGLDALWNDDFHHSAMVALTGRNEAYYTDYHGSPQEFISSAKYGYLYQGQR